MSLSQHLPFHCGLGLFLRKPHLASYVQYVNFDTHKGRRLSSDYRDWKDLRTIPADRGIMIDYIQGIPITFKEQWIKKLQQNRYNAYLALFLCLLTNLRGLFLGPNCRFKSRLIGKMLQSGLIESNPSVSSFQILQEVEIIFPGIESLHPNSRNTQNMLSFFYLPSLRRLRLFIDCPTDFKWPGKFPPNAVNLKWLEIAGMEEGFIGKILSRTPQLETFRWHRHFAPWRVTNTVFAASECNLTLFAADLFLIRERLQDLIIVVDDAQYHDDIFRYKSRSSFIGSFGTFESFEALKNLRIPVRFLFTPSAEEILPLSKILPRSLEKLSLTNLDIHFASDEAFHFQKFFLAWVYVWTDVTPNLARVKILLSSHHPAPIWEEAIFPTLEDKCEEAGIRFYTTNCSNALPEI